MKSPVTSIAIGQLAPQRLIEAIEDSLARILERAFELYAQRNGGEGAELEDWLAAEHDLFNIPAADLKEKDSRYESDVAAAGYRPEEIEVAVEPAAVVVRARSSREDRRRGVDTVISELSNKELFRRVELCHPIDTDHVAASMEEGVLHVVMPKAASDRRVAAA